jgi:hypothetical protein
MEIKVKGQVDPLPSHTNKTSRGHDGKAPCILNLALYGFEWCDSRFFRFTPSGIALGTCWIGRCVGPKIGLDASPRATEIWKSGLTALASGHNS